MELSEARSVTSEALAMQATEFDSVDPVVNSALYGLQQWRPDRVVELVLALKHGERAERQLGARILAESKVPEIDKYDLAVEAMTGESDPEVIRSWVQVLQWSKQSQALPVLSELVKHASPAVRHALPDALSWCSDLVFEQIAAPLLDLAEDEDDEVRWSALWEIREWSQYSDDPRIAARLATVSKDPSPEVRELLRFYDDGGDSDE